MHPSIHLSIYPSIHPPDHRPPATDHHLIHAPLNPFCLFFFSPSFLGPVDFPSPSCARLPFRLRIHAACSSFVLPSPLHNLLSSLLLILLLLPLILSPAIFSCFQSSFWQCLCSSLKRPCFLLWPLTARTALDIVPLTPRIASLCPPQTGTSASSSSATTPFFFLVSHSRLCSTRPSAKLTLFLSSLTLRSSCAAHSRLLATSIVHQPQRETPSRHRPPPQLSLLLRPSIVDTVPTSLVYQF